MSPQQPGSGDFAMAGAPGDGASPKRRRRGRTAVIVLVVIVVVLVILAVIADFAARNYAENRAEKQIESNLPTGTTGTVDVKIHGFSVILQALSGSLSDVNLSSSDIVASGVPLIFSADVKDVPLKSGGETGAVDATVKLSQAALNKSAVLGGVTGQVALGSGDFTYDSSIKFLSLSIGYRVTVDPSLSDGGKQLVLTPTKADVTNGGSAFDVSTLLNFLKSSPPKVCIAESLPAGSSVTKVAVTPKQVTLDLHNTGLPLSSAGLSTKGSCS
ncbi:LmeA family phospholipid-binding protein [Frondihabitans cladoniiphilus]|uniref:DUF2993 family protein n=1 Tax=Frondihabitans cladoniiphilus TaxID=715785 RepID=A0ABP8VJW0_9MICO